jgi:hypothetical protein
MPSLAEQSENRRYTYADILEWDDGKRYELYDGEAYMMAPPVRIHQEISGAIFNRQCPGRYALQPF